ncbi:NUDIX hydrolase [Bacillus carboniphilus]|uniref:NUDIX hydrolase n=1 Tax=Bacillus carboniphilus TaxID=86663 RepID=A0ABY9JUY6_9BACI|nr:NUDIX hydrolase [Bacillus carboniphilus]WLR43219.1 NUDIX hydrolase [Bacillus carboniphilus]
MGYVEELRKIVGHRPLILVGAVVIIIDGEGRLLLQQRKYPKESWGLPGGLMELGESTEEVARRELFEETGLEVNELELINVYSGKDNFVIAENGDEFYVVTIAYFAEGYKGEIKIDQSEINKCEFLYPNELPEKIVKSHQVILDEFLEKYDKEK